MNINSYLYVNVNKFTPLFKGNHGIDDEVYLSLPCVLNSNGVSHVIRQILTSEEMKQLQNSAKLMHNVQVGLKY